MKQNPNFLLREIAGTPYLLPFGQMIADHKRGLQLNETGVYIWNLLEEERTLEELLTICSDHFEISREELSDFRVDITCFLRQLISYGLIIDEEIPSCSNLSSQMLGIGGLNVDFQGPVETFPEEFQPFLIENPNTIHQTIHMRLGAPTICHNGTLLLRNSELVVIEQEDLYILLFPTFSQIVEMHITRDGSQVICYYMPPYSTEFRTSLFHALRFTYLYLALLKGKVALHSASLLYENKLWLFSGPSGTGKSTHTNLWKELFDTPLINGDLNLIDTSTEEVTVPGIPWCGTSGICHTETYPLGGILLLKQAPSDYIEELSPTRKELLVSQRLISPSWTADLYDLHLQAMKKIAGQAVIGMLHCTKEPTAAQCMKKWIDAQ